jgi:citrate lyase beta subunit
MSERFDARITRLEEIGQSVAAAYPGERPDRQPVHTVYGGAHLFRADIAARLGASARQTLDEYAPEFASFARTLHLPGSDRLPRSPQVIDGLERRLAAGDDSALPAARLAHTVYTRVREKLAREPVEDFRVDFEDGYGNRSDEEEDREADRVGGELARGVAEGTLPAFIGIRIKPLSEELGARALRTLERVITGTLRAGPRRLPGNFVVTLPKITNPAQVEILVETLDHLEAEHGLARGTIPIELMVETPQSVFGRGGEAALPGQVAAARGRCRGAHFGTYDYTASLGITAAHQRMHHPACVFARNVMQAALAGTGVWISDGSTTLLPVPPHRAGSEARLDSHQRRENRLAVHRAWRMHFEDVRRSLELGFYQGWDLNPGQLPTRYAAVFAFFLEARDEAAERLRRFVDRAAQATLLGNVFDDAATGQGLLNFFLRGLNCGAITEAEALSTGLSLEELHGRSFVKILNARRGVPA